MNLLAYALAAAAVARQVIEPPVDAEKLKTRAIETCESYRDELESLAAQVRQSVKGSKTCLPNQAGEHMLSATRSLGFALLALTEG